MCDDDECPRCENSYQECTDCGNEVCACDDECEDCNNLICSECTKYCENCDNVLCSDCRYECDACGEYYCDNCYNDDTDTCNNCAVTPEDEEFLKQEFINSAEFLTKYIPKTHPIIDSLIGMAYNECPVTVFRDADLEHGFNGTSQGERIYTSMDSDDKTQLWEIIQSAVRQITKESKIHTIRKKLRLKLKR